MRIKNFKTIIALLVAIGCLYLQAQAQKRKLDQVLGTKQLKLTVGEKVLYADFNDNLATRDFIKLLSLTLTMDDLHGREKSSTFKILMIWNIVKT